MIGDSKSITPPGLRAFMQELETRLGRLSHEEVKLLLIERARGLAPRERNDFLSIFAAVDGVVTDAVEDSSRDDELIDDIDSFVQALEDGEYYEYWGWDDSIHDERAYGDMSWIGEMDDLFARASEMYLAGHRDLAAEAYGKLLEAFSLDEEVGHFCGEDSADMLVETDIAEAKARYLRCVYELSSPNDRISRMLDEMDNLRCIGGKIGFSDIIDADTRPLPDEKEFLREWIAGLKSMESAEATRLRQDWWRPLLREAVVLQDGVDGLAALAKESGDVHPEAYHDWVKALWQSGSSDSAMSAAKEGVERIVSDGHKAHLADALATIACATDSALAITARRQAWRASPTLQRLVSFCSEGSPDRQALEARLSEELREASAGSYTIRSMSGCSEEISRLHLLLHLLLHDYDIVVRQTENMDSLGWATPEHPGPIVFPFLAIAADGKTDRPAEGSSLASLLDGVADACGSYHSDSPLLPDTTSEPVEQALGRLILDTLASHPVEADDRERYLNLAKKIAKKRIDAIVSNTHRGAYERAARLAVAVGETLSLQGELSSGTDFVVSIRDSYPRHTAFRKELESLTDSSPYLRSLPRKVR